MRRTIAVTGASGHLGNVVCRLLCEQGWQVRALCRTDTRALQGVPAEICYGDVLDLQSLIELFSGCDTVIHCAAIISLHGDPDGTVFRTNTEGPANVLKAAIQCKVRRIVHISSVHAVEELPHQLPFDEKRPYKKANACAYDFSKATGEQILLKSGEQSTPEVIVLRPSAIIGPYDFKPSELGKALLDFFGRKIPALPEGGYNFVDVRDVAQTVIRAIDQGQPGQVYLATGKYYSMKAFARVVQDVSGIKTSKIVIPYPVMRSFLPFIRLWALMSRTKPLFSREAIDAVKHGHPAMDNSKAVSELDHRYRPLEESIRDFYAWRMKNFNQI